METVPTEQTYGQDPLDDGKRYIDPEEPKNKLTSFHRVLSRLAQRGNVELRGSAPVPYEERTVTRFYDVFSIWFCMSTNPLP